MENKMGDTEQQKLVLESRHPVKRVIACAGSGKTRILTRSIAEAIKSGECRPGQILALTFTINAAENMRRRVNQLMGNGELDLDIHTFNSFGNEIIYQNSFELGLGKDFQLITSSHSWNILYEVFRQVELDAIKVGKDYARFIQQTLLFIEDIKNNLVSIDDLQTYLAGRKDILKGYKSKALREEEEKLAREAGELFEVYRRYEKIKWERNMIDYSDQVFLPYMLLSRRKALAEKYRQKYRYILIDEFQDTNVAQARLLTLLYKRNYNRLMIVGDDDQGIYSFRGACVENILGFDSWDCFRDEDIRDFYLSVNFRSGDGILGPINSLICKNQNRFSKTMQSSDKGRKSNIFFNVEQTLEGEAAAIASYIKDLTHSRGVKPGDIAIISRRKRFEKIAKALRDNDIRYELIGSRNFYYEPEVLFLISWLKIVEDINDEISMVYLLKSGKYRIGDRDIFFLKNGATGGKSRSLIEGIRCSDKNDYVSGPAKERLASFLESLLLYIKKSGIMDLKELISFMYRDSGLSDELRSGFGRSSRNRIRNVERLIKIAADFKKGPADTGNSGFIMYIQDVARADYEDPDTLEITGGNSVKLMSIHAAKGLEFSVVVIPMLWKNDYLGKGTNTTRFAIPSALRKDSPVWSRKGDFKSASAFRDALKAQKTEEERRIFYVACSRARDILLLSHSVYENNEDRENEGKRPKEIVPFFVDLVKGSRGIKAMGRDSALFLKGILGDYREGEKPGERLREPGGVTGKKSILARDHDWKKAEHQLGGILGKLACPGQEDICRYFKDEFSMEVDGKALAGALDSWRRAQEVDEEEVPSLCYRKVFSLTPLLDYIECPSLYRFRYIYNIPGRQDKNMMLGERIHEYIENITRIMSRSGTIDVKTLLYDMEEDIKPYIETFLESRLADFSSPGPDNIYLERLFYHKAGDSFITGKLDRLDIKGKHAEIIDYKTAKGKKSGLSHRYRRQLSVYVSAVSDITCLPLSCIRGSIFYLGDGSWDHIRGDENSIGADLGLLSETIDRIKGEDFGPQGRQDCSNKHCQYRHLCL